jgi:hypothetical protein
MEINMTMKSIQNTNKILTISLPILVVGIIISLIMFTNDSTQTQALSAPLITGDVQSQSVTSFNSSQELPAMCGNCNAPPREPHAFLASGGKSVVIITPNLPGMNLPKGNQFQVNHFAEIKATRGSTIHIPLTLTHVSSSNPLPQVVLVGGGGHIYLTPAYLANLYTTEQRVDAVKAGQPIAGAIDLFSLETFSPKQVILLAGESKQVDLYISIPNWPDQMIGSKIYFPIMFLHGENYDYHDLMTVHTGVLIDIAN